MDFSVPDSQDGSFFRDLLRVLVKNYLFAYSRYDTISSAARLREEEFRIKAYASKTKGN